MVLYLKFDTADNRPLYPLGEDIIDKIKNLYFRQRLGNAINKYDSNEFDNG